MKKIVLIIGTARSGSTILERVLSQMAKMQSVGEFRLIFDEGFGKNYLCGCEKPFDECEFWSKVVNSAFDLAPVPNNLDQLWYSVDRFRFLPFLIFPRLQPKCFQKKYVNYLQLLEQLYDSIFKVSRNNNMVDSSKAPTHGFMLKRLSELSKLFELKVIFLVRDSRAVVNSMKKRKKNPAGGNRVFLEKKGVIASSFDWLISTIGCEAFRVFHKETLRIRYEDFADEPERTVSQILRFLEMKDVSVKGFHNNSLQLDASHTVAGNPIRLNEGLVNIKTDESWKNQLSVIEKLIVTFFTWPLIWRYGYLSSRHR